MNIKRISEPLTNQDKYLNDPTYDFQIERYYMSETSSLERPSNKKRIHTDFFSPYSRLSCDPMLER